METIRKISIADLDFEYKLWKNELHYLKTELEIYEYRLEGIRIEFKERVDKAEVNSVEEKIHTYKYEIVSLMNRIMQQEEEMTAYVKDYPINKEHQNYRGHKKLKDEMIQLSTEYMGVIKVINENLAEFLYV